MSQIQLAFEIAATCHQILETVGDWTEEEIIEGLQTGRMATSTWHEGYDTQTAVELIATGEEVAKIKSQQIDGEYTDFR